MTILRQCGAPQIFSFPEHLAQEIIQEFPLIEELVTHTAASDCYYKGAAQVVTEVFSAFRAYEKTEGSDGLPLAALLVADLTAARALLPSGGSTDYQKVSDAVEVHRRGGIWANEFSEGCAGAYQAICTLLQGVLGDQPESEPGPKDDVEVGSTSESRPASATSVDGSFWGAVRAVAGLGGTLRCEIVDERARLTMLIPLDGADTLAIGDIGEILKGLPNQPTISNLILNGGTLTVELSETL